MLGMTTCHINKIVFSNGKVQIIKRKNKNEPENFNQQ